MKCHVFSIPTLKFVIIHVIIFILANRSIQSRKQSAHYVLPTVQEHPNKSKHLFIYSCLPSVHTPWYYSSRSVMFPAHFWRTNYCALVKQTIWNASLLNRACQGSPSYLSHFIQCSLAVAIISSPAYVRYQKSKATVRQREHEWYFHVVGGWICSKPVWFQNIRYANRFES